ncbi:hypothetical protein [Burkholderia multivorans]|uniref:hypothetical protein n=1 Tax=Burkholderia multivorans TaxID=87883 RepID=UPI0011225626|nr:hypothetical protein [Burkholderia multivorans]
MNHVLLDDISETLASGGLNYCVFLKTYTFTFSGPIQSDAIVSTVLGRGAIAINFVEIGVESVIETVKSSLLYAGDDSAGPSKAVLESEDLTGIIEELLSDLRHVMSQATKIEAFTLKEGHPFYSVFWDFAFMFRTASIATIFIGASSD